MGIVVFGAVFVDIKGYPDNKFIPGGRNVGRVIQTHGGVSRNVAEDIANVGLRPTFVSVVDDNGTGEDVVGHLHRQHVNTDYILRHPDGMGTWLATFDHCGDVVASISKRPDLSPLIRIVEEHGDELISGADSVVVEMDLEPDLLDRIFSHHTNAVMDPLAMLYLYKDHRQPVFIGDVSRETSSSFSASLGATLTAATRALSSSISCSFSCSRLYLSSPTSPIS